MKMEFVNVVFNAARDGKLRRLKVFLDHRTKAEVDVLVSARTAGATPLTIACRNGHADVVRYLLDKCHADPELVGSVVFDDEMIEDAPPLWCAAAAGHFSIVQLLVQRAANVNATTRTHSTPLRAACFDGHYDIARFLVDHGADMEIANRHGHTCLMISCYKGHMRIAQFLVARGARIERSSVKGNTALHDCAESGSLDILKFLLANGATLQPDSYGITPLLAAAVCGHSCVVEYMLCDERRLVSRQQHIDALQLLGATCVDKKSDLVAATRCWKRALDKRYEETGTTAPPPISRDQAGESRAAYGHVREACTHQQLDELISDPDRMRMQALIMRERILGAAHPDTSYYIRYRGAVYADTGNFERCIQLWMYALSMQQLILEPLSPLTQSSLLSFAELFSFMMHETRSRHLNNQHHQDHQAISADLNFDDVFQVFVCSVDELVRGQQHLTSASPSSVSTSSQSSCVFTARQQQREGGYLSRTLTITMYLLSLLARCLDNTTSSPAARSQEQQRRRETVCRQVYRLLRCRVASRSGLSPLHLACGAQRSSNINSTTTSSSNTAMARYPSCSLPSLPVVKLLLSAGADVDARDMAGNTPLLTLAVSSSSSSSTAVFRADIARCLLAAGAHVDVANKAGDTLYTMLPPPSCVKTDSSSSSSSSSDGAEAEAVDSSSSGSDNSPSQLSSTQSPSHAGENEATARLTGSGSGDAAGPDKQRAGGNGGSSVVRTTGRTESGASNAEQEAVWPLASLQLHNHVSLQCVAARAVRRLVCPAVARCMLPPHLVEFVQMH